MIKFKTEPNKNSLETYQWLQNREKENVPLYNNIITAPKEGGVFINNVIARWDKGHSGFK